MRFEWDEEKAAANIRKHGITFDMAAKVFADEYRLDFYDEAHSLDEDRYITIGLYKKVLFVVYTERRDAIRLISARLATAEERRLYYGR